MHCIVTSLDYLHYCSRTNNLSIYCNFVATNVKSIVVETPAFTNEHLQASMTVHPTLLCGSILPTQLPTKSGVPDMWQVATVVNYMGTVKTAQEFRRLG